MSQSKRFDGKAAIGTGAASKGAGLGIGKATALLFARKGAKVLLINRSEARRPKPPGFRWWPGDCKR